MDNSDAKQNHYVLRLFICGIKPNTTMNIFNLKQILEQELKDQYCLEVIDITKHPECLKKEDIVALPTLIKDSPLPVRHLICDMSNKDKVLVGLDLIPHPS